MKYISTRSNAHPVDFKDVLLSGLAPDGGLYIPETWPRFTLQDFESWRGLPYADLAFQIMRPFIGGSIPDADFKRMVDAAYAAFHHPDITPLHKLSDDLYILELFHGPTLAFKDVALQMLGQLFDHVLTEKNEHAVIVGATSGDTGSAAIEAMRRSARAHVFMMHPAGRVSEVQRRQMTTVLAGNIVNIAIKGDFDDCQAQVKKLFADQDFVSRLRAKNFRLSAVNSINWARIMAQIVYYVYTALKIGAPERKIRFAVPTGNFGNVYAAYCARQMGLPIGDLLIATNKNDIVSRFFQTGRLEKHETHPTLSNAMDIQVSSNFERFLFDLLGRDADKTANAMHEFATAGRYIIAPGLHNKAQGIFASASVSDDETLQTIQSIYRDFHYIADPHTAVGLCAAAKNPVVDDVATIALACAAPAKFPEAVEKAIGIKPDLPPQLTDLHDREERVFALANDHAAVKEFILSRI